MAEGQIPKHRLSASQFWKEHLAAWKYQVIQEENYRRERIAFRGQWTQKIKGRGRHQHAGEQANLCDIRLVSFSSADFWLAEGVTKQLVNVAPEARSLSVKTLKPEASSLPFGRCSQIFFLRWTNWLRSEMWWLFILQITCILLPPFIFFQESLLFKRCAWSHFKKVQSTFDSHSGW